MKKRSSEAATIETARSVWPRLAIISAVRQEQWKIAAGRHYLTGLSLVAVCSLFSVANAVEIAAFRTTGFTSQIDFKFDTNERIANNAGIEVSYTQQTSFVESIFVNTQNYVFHPRFLRLNLGAGVSFLQESYTGINDNNDHAYNLNIGGTLLEKKPYATKFYYRRSNPIVRASQRGAVKQVAIDYGVDLNFKETPLPIKLDLYIAHDKSNASSQTRAVN